MANLETQFSDAMFDIYRRAKTEAKCNDGGLATAKTLISLAKPPGISVIVVD